MAVHKGEAFSGETIELTREDRFAFCVFNECLFVGMGAEYFRGCIFNQCRAELKYLADECTKCIFVQESM